MSRAYGGNIVVSFPKAESEEQARRMAARLAATIADLDGVDFEVDWLRGDRHEDETQLTALRRMVSHRARGTVHIPLVVDMAAHTAILDGHPLTFTARTWAMFALLIQQPGRVFATDEISSAMPPHDREPAELVRFTSFKLRGELGRISHYLHTAVGVGYSLNLPAGSRIILGEPEKQLIYTN